MLVTEVVCSRVCASHCQTRQPVTRDSCIGTPTAPHLLSSANFSQFQSAYSKGRTETALGLLKVLDGVFTAADDKQVTVLTGLDLMSAAFDTVDHRLLLDRLRLEF